MIAMVVLRLFMFPLFTLTFLLSSKEVTSAKIEERGSARLNYVREQINRKHLKTSIHQLLDDQIRTDLSNFSVITDGTWGVQIGQETEKLQPGGTEVSVEKFGNLNAAISAIGLSTGTVVISNVQTLSNDLTVPSNVTIRFTGNGRINVSAGTTITISGPIEATLRQIFSGSGKVILEGGRNPRVYPLWWGAKGDGVTDDSTAIQSMLNAAIQKGIGTAEVYFPAGTYKISQTLTAGVSGSRSSGLIIEGAGRFATTLLWVGSKSDTLLKLLNCHMATVRDIRLQGSTKGKCGLWFDVEDGQSGFMPRTDNVYIGNFSYGLLIGGGDLMSSGQCNAGLHNNLYITDFDEAVRITGANVEVQTFLNFNVVGEGTRVFQSLNGRGIYVLSGEADINNTGNNTRWFLEASGGNIFGGGFYLGNMRIEGLSGLAYFSSSGESGTAPITFVADHIIGVSIPRGGLKGPTDVIRLAGPGSVTVRSSIFPQDKARFFFEGINNSKYVSFTLEECQINNATADSDPSTLVYVTSLGRAGNAGGVKAVLWNNTYIESSSPYQQIGRIADRIIQITPDDVAASRVDTLWGANNRGIEIGGGATITKHLSATTTWDPQIVANDAIASMTVAVAGAEKGDTVNVGYSQAVPAGALLVGAVTAENTVTVTLFNKTGRALNLAAGTMRADVWKH